MPFSIRPYRRVPCILPGTRLFSFFSLIALLVMSNGLAYAEWLRVSPIDAGVGVYADPDSTRRKGELVRMWSLYDFQTEQYTRRGQFLSSKGRIEYDCANERIRGLAVEEFSRHMGEGTVVYADSSESKWIPVPPQGVVQALWMIACEKM